MRNLSEHTIIAVRWWGSAYISCALGLLLLCGCQRSTPVTQQQIEQFLKAVDAAAARKDPSVLLDHLAKDAVIRVRSAGAFGPQIKTYTAKEYRASAKEQMALLKDYKYQRQETKIDIAPDKKIATITLKISEVLTIPQGTFHVESVQVSKCCAKDDKLLLNSIDSTAISKLVTPSPRAPQKL
jgi:hypothetical protein